MVGKGRKPGALSSKGELFGLPDRGAGKRREVARPMSELGLLNSREVRVSYRSLS